MRKKEFQSMTGEMLSRLLEGEAALMNVKWPIGTQEPVKQLSRLINKGTLRLRNRLLALYSDQGFAFRPQETRYLSGQMFNFITTETLEPMWDSLLNLEARLEKRSERISPEVTGSLLNLFVIRQSMLGMIRKQKSKLGLE